VTIKVKLKPKDADWFDAVKEAFYPRQEWAERTIGMMPLLEPTIEECLKIEREFFELLEWTWRGLSPEGQERFIEACVPYWSEVRRLDAEISKVVKLMLKRKAEAGDAS
jgi:hypothetical protein